MAADTLVQVGRSTRVQIARQTARIEFLGRLVRSALAYPPAALPLLARTLMNQIRFTALHALPFVVVVATVVGLVVLVETMGQVARFGLTDMLGRIFVTVVVHEIGPLLTAIIVLGRSGTAIAAELATSDVLGEMDAMESLGVDRMQLWVLPRVLGGAISVTILTVYFNVATVLSGAVFADLLGHADVGALLEFFRVGVSVSDVGITVLKSALFGAGIAFLCSYEGMGAGGTPTGIPQCVTRGVVASLAFVILVSTVFSLALFL